jgi:hypothetical protein
MNTDGGGYAPAPVFMDPGLRRDDDQSKFGLSHRSASWSDTPRRAA